MRYPFHSFLLAYWVSLLAAMPAIATADDTDLYLRQAKQIDESVRPNILFVLDYSGSMNTTDKDPDTGQKLPQTRMEMLQSALLEVLDSASNVNVGMEQFTNANFEWGGCGNTSGDLNTPIIYPVSYIDGQAKQNEGDTEDIVVVAPLTSGMDDGSEKLNDSKEVDLDSDELKMTYLPPVKSVGMQLLEASVMTAADDAREFLGGGSERAGKVMATGDSWLSLGGSTSRGETITGLRFPDINIPQGATILAAQVVFTSDNDSFAKSNKPIAVAIHGLKESDADADPFANGDYNISTRPQTDNFIEWDIPSWNQKKQQENSPDLSSIIQELVDQPAWKEGNALGLRFVRTPTYPEDTTDGHRKFYNEERNKEEYNPKLKIAYTTKEGVSTGSTSDLFAQMGVLLQRIDNTYDDAHEFRGGGQGSMAMEPGLVTYNNHLRLGNGYCNDGRNCRGEELVGLRFPDIDLPKGAVILSADIEFTLRSGDGVNAKDPLDLEIYLENSLTPKPFEGEKWQPDNPLFDISKRPRTPEFISWPDVPSPKPNGALFYTPDLSSLIQTMVDRDDWRRGNSDLAFLLARASGKGARNVFDYSNGHNKAALLRINWVPESVGGGFEETTEGVDQLVALRFQNPEIPSGATITSARIDFTSRAGLDNPAELAIRLENTPNSEALTEEPGNISKRSVTGAVDWQPEAWVQGEQYSTPDLSTLLQPMVSQAGWCGNRSDITFMISSASGNPLRSAYSYDASSAHAPVLRVTYDPKTVPDNTCIDQTYTSRIIASSDDAEELVTDKGTMYLDSLDLQMTTNGSGERIIGLRYQDIPVRQGAKIINAKLVFTAYRDSSDEARLFIHGEKNGDAAAFEGYQGELSERKKTDAMATWAMSADAEQQWLEDNTYAVEITDVVQEVVSQGSWAVFNDMAFYVSGSGLRESYSYDRSPMLSTELRITVEGLLGPEGSGVTDTVRLHLKNIVRGMSRVETDNGTFCTPIIDALYEAGTYFRSEEVFGGLTRHGRRTLRVSHPLSHDGEIFIPEGCTQDDPLSTKCEDEEITSIGALYSSPITSNCQANHIVLLSDGIANVSKTKSKIQALIGSKGLSCANRRNNDEECGPELAKFLHEYEQHPSIASSTLTVHTIGFMLKSDPQAAQFLKDIAASGGGNFYEAESAEALVDAFQSILGDAMTESTSFASPSVSINAFHKMYHNNDVYFSLFQPEHKVSWKGNVKKYQLCSDPSRCDLGSVQDKNGNPLTSGGGEAETDSDSSKIRDEVFDAWNATGTADGGTITAGGAGSVLPEHALRNIYTNLSGSSGVDLTAASNAVHVTNDQLTAAVFNDHDNLSYDDLLELSNGNRDALINWIRGKDRSWSFGDPLHASPVVVNYGKGTNSRVLIATNEGGIRMLNESTGVEEWMFIPRDLLGIQETIRQNPSLHKRVYGVDSTPSVLQQGSSVQMFIGMRRGGRNIYALDISTPRAPKLMWTIFGGQDANYQHLGQTWSRPTPVRIKFGSKTRLGLVFGGGYDPDTQDVVGARNKTEIGNAIYIADPATGERLWWASGTGTGADLQLSGMNYSIPSDLAMFDSDGDGAVDRIYVGDTGGQLWRIDTDKQVGGTLARLGSSNAKANYRRFFYPPDIVRLKDNQYSAEPYYDLILIESGERFDPLGTDITNRLYAIRDRALFGLTNDGSGNAMQDTPAFLGEGADAEYKFFTISEDYLYDATDNLIQDTVQLDAELPKLKRALGWYVTLPKSGEKGLASPVVLDGKAYFTTFEPPSGTGGSACVANEGKSWLYVIDVLTGGAAEQLQPNEDSPDAEDSSFSKQDRARSIGAGIPSGAIPIFQADGISIVVGTGGGLYSHDTGVTPIPEQVFWMED